jgi:hypothetical protein
LGRNLDGGDGAPDDPANGLSSAANPDSVVTSGYPGEVAVSLHKGSGVFYSTDYGMSWHEVGNSVTGSPNGVPIQWAHANSPGSPSVIMMQTATTTYVADMTAANPSFIPMTQPYAPPGQAIAVGDGADQAWLATVWSTPPALCRCIRWRRRRQPLRLSSPPPPVFSRHPRWRSGSAVRAPWVCRQRPWSSRRLAR